MHTSADNEDLPGLKYRTIGLGLLSEATHYIKNKAKKFARKQVEEVASDIVNNQATLKEAVTDKVAALAKVGRGRPRKRKRSRSVSRSVRRVKRKTRASKKTGRKSGGRPRRRRRRRREGRKGRKHCLKGTIFS